MRLPDILPPADLLDKVEGVKRGLRQRRRLGRIGWAGFLLASALQIVVAAVNSPYWQALANVDWRKLSSLVITQWPYLAVLFLPILFLLLAGWARFWLKESEAPFRYTCSIAGFRPIASPTRKEGEDDSESIWSWLSHDLAERLSQRVGRLRFLSEAEGQSPAGTTCESHVHLSGSYGIRRDREDRPVVEVMARVRIGPPGSPETLAHPVAFRLPTPAGNAAPSLDALSPKSYERIVERVYFSVATELYRQIQRDVADKIALLPTHYFRAVALFHEAEDYARSNTLDAYDEARDLYDRSMKLLDPRLRSLPASRALRFGRYLRHAGLGLWRSLERPAIHLWPRLGHVELICARAEIGYASMLLYRRYLAAMSGQRLNPVFEARPVAERAVRRLQRLPRDLAGRQRSLFEAHVILALAFYSLGAAPRGDRHLAAARCLDPNRTVEDARYLFVAGMGEVHRRSKLQLFRRAVELEPRFEVAQFVLAAGAEALWRTRPTFERNVAEMVFAEYDEVSKINPGNIAAWANRGYMHWLLGEDEDMQRAQEAFENGREYKAMKRVTFVAELDHGLARIAAEKGDFRRAYEHYIAAVSATLAQGHDSGQYGGYHFEQMGEALFQRFVRYRDRVEKHWARRTRSNAAAATARVRNSVLAFVLNDYGEACFQYYLWSGDETFLAAARSAYRRCIDELNPGFVMPYFNLHRLSPQDGEADQAQLEEAQRCLEKVEELAPEWPEGQLAQMQLKARLAKQRSDQAAASQQEAELADAEARATYDAAYEKARDTLQGRQPVAKKPAQPPEVLEKRAKDLAKDAERLRKQAEDFAREAIEGVEALVPHRWLWHLPTGDTQARFRWDALDTIELDEELRWERECNEVHVRALYTLGLILRLQGHSKKTWTLLSHIRKHFWPNDVSVHQDLRGILSSQVVTFLERERYAQLFAQPAHRQLLEDDRRVSLLQQGAWMRLLWHSRDYRTLLRDRHFRRAVTSEAYRKLLALRLLRSDTAGPELARLVQQNLITFLRGPAYQELAKQSSYRTLMLNEDHVACLRDGRWRRLFLRCREYRQLWRQRPLRQLLHSEDYRRLLHYAESDRAIRVFVERSTIEGEYPQWALTWVAEDSSFATDEDPILGHTAARREGRKTILERASQLENRSPFFYKWVGERLQGIGGAARLVLRAYRNAKRSDDPRLLFEVARGFKALGELAESLAAFRAAMSHDGSRDSRVLPEGRYRREIGCVLWAQGDPREAVREFDRITDEPDVSWRTDIVYELLPRIESPEAYQLLRSWLEGQRRHLAPMGNETALQDALRAGLVLVREKYALVGQAPAPVSALSREMLPLVVPIVLEADARLFPEGEDWAASHRLFTEYIPGMRARIEQEIGLRVPGLRVRGNDGDLQRHGYLIMLDEVPLVAGTVDPNALFCPDAGRLGPLPGKKAAAFKPAYNPLTGEREGAWIPAVARAAAAPAAQMELWDHFQYMISHVEAVLRRHLERILGLQEMENMLEAWQAGGEAGEASMRAELVRTALPDLQSKLQLLQVLKRLLREQVPIRDLATILRIFRQHREEETSDRHLLRLLAAIRLELRESLPGNDPGFQFLRLSPGFEAEINAAIVEVDGRTYLTLPPDRAQALLGAFRKAVEGRRLGRQVLVTRDERIRPFVRRLIDLELPPVAVLSAKELRSSLRKSVVDTVEHPPARSTA